MKSATDNLIKSCELCGKKYFLKMEEKNEEVNIDFIGFSNSIR